MINNNVTLFKIILFKKIDSSVSCGFTTTLTFEDQYIYTPNYPEKYPESTECKWYINIPKDGYMEYVLKGKAESGFDFLKVFVPI